MSMMVALVAAGCLVTGLVGGVLVGAVSVLAGRMDREKDS